MTTTVGSEDQLSTEWLGLQTIGFVGGVASILNGPTWTGTDQLPALSRVRRWNHHDPSASRALVVPVAVSSAVFAVPGSVAGCSDHAYENPSTPLEASA